MRYEKTVAIAADPARVWAVLADVTHWSDWTPTVIEARRVDDGEFGVGSRVRLIQPKVPGAVWRITEFEADRSFVWDTRMAGTTLTAGHRVRPADNGGSVVLLTIEHTGLLAGMLDLAAGKRMRAYVDTEAASLRAACEAAN